MSRNVRWTLWMTAWGLFVAFGAYWATGSVGWAVVGLFAAGLVVNLVANPHAR